ncbi:FAD-dependent monooxygenase [Nocardia sp. NPDC051787]|uniref:FAD-dependent oxidoreductase n=1 Tax=Nocardia sp. NPDC051787 TaxID=3155415 RepID=UPI0034342A2C
MADSGHAVVIGGSIAGMCTARALRGRFGKITILEQDVLPTQAQGRRGTPQAWHNHFLLDVGREAIESLFPGFTERLLELGGMDLDPGYHGATCFATGWMPRARTRMSVLFASRPTLEAAMRDVMRGDSGIELREGMRVLALLSDDSGPEAVVTGVSYRERTGARGELAADFVVDATGRGSRSPAWMRELGFEIEELTLDAKVSYSSRLYRLPEESVAWWKWMTVLPDSDPNAPEAHQYLCIVFPIENNFIIAMMGSWGLPTPTDALSFERLARDTRSPEFARVLDAAQPMSEVHHTRSTHNRWRRFDRLSTPPPRFIAVGDAVGAFNPIYGQGMSCAAVTGLIVQRLARDLDPLATEFPAAFYAEQARFLRRPWALALTRDRGYEHARGTETISAGPHQRLLRRVNWPAFQFFAEAVWQDAALDRHFDRLLNVRESLPEFLTNPRVLAGLGLYGTRRLLGLTRIPSTVPAHLPPPGTDYSSLRRLEVSPHDKALVHRVHGGTQP